MGRQSLALSEAEFWSTTPRCLFALAERKRGEDRRQDLRFGLLASLLYNVNRGKGAKPMGPADFFPDAAEPKQQSRPQMLAALAEIRGLIGSKTEG